MAAKDDEHRIEEARRALRGAGLRSTAPRLAVYEHLRRAGRPLSHADVADELGPRGFDRASIYRILIDLSEAGLATRHDFGDHIWRFELCDAGKAGATARHEGQHAHFVCTDCGDVECLPDVEVKLPRALLRRAMAIEVKGVCKRCA